MVSTIYDIVTLHGNLDVEIHRAKSLPNMDLVSEGFRKCFNFCATPFPATRGNCGEAITSDPYVKVVLGQDTVARTSVINNNQNPCWGERFLIPVAHDVSYIEFVVKDNDVCGADVIGSAYIPALSIFKKEEIERKWFPISDHWPLRSVVPPDGPHLQITVKYTPVEENMLYQHGIAGDPDHLGVRESYFPLRKGGMVTLYQDAHVRDNEIGTGGIVLDDGEVLHHGKCWEDICHAIWNAKHLIYITGWSIYVKVRLVREPTKPFPEGVELNLGDLLKRKSREGVKVCLLVWDDRTSSDGFSLMPEGIMGTHDEETRKFFRHSSVSCLLSPRYGSTALSYFKKQVVENFYTHHQKSVLVDTEAPKNKRKITAFIGGLDLRDGRYDTPSHRLFTDLDTVFPGDICNPSLHDNAKAGPRQPWHDLHCKIDGPAAYDVLANFEQRWRKAKRWWDYGPSPTKGFHWSDDGLIKIESEPAILGHSLTVSNKEDKTTWHVPKDDPKLWVNDDKNTWHAQIFRSIDSGSVKGFPQNVQEATIAHLTPGKNLIIDKSIHTAYVEAIRSARHFIYIENQYFIGSSYGWKSHKDAGANNLIPMELALKIASKIRAEEPFAVYIVIPMWPEGNPDSSAMRTILFWQAQTMKMMYAIIAKAIKSKGLQTHPQNYLNFYCLGKREKYSSDKTSKEPSFKCRRFMIYVHSKGMIVDDEYIIVGSANINERSLNGSRDTEIAMGAYQPRHTRTRKHPRGQVYGYRMSLWAEHLGSTESWHSEPHNPECVRSVNQIAEENWLRYTAPDPRVDLQGHLLRYPLQVSAEGKVRSILGQDTFPDVGGKIEGSLGMLPHALTT